MATSIAELLPRPFDEITVEDVGQLVDSGRPEQRETVYLEFKRQPTADKLAKSCAAFANTVGGLLVVGVDDEGQIVGCQRPAGEPQVWVKDVLRPQVTPLPPFRVRWLPMDAAGDRGLLVVLVERSSTTPHLLVNLGAIYIRNPGSSDPVPFHDARTLADLVAQGDRAAGIAADRVSARLMPHRVGSEPFDGLVGGEHVVLAATGIPDGFDRQLFAAMGVEHVRRAVIESFGAPFENDVLTNAQISPPRWSQDAVWMERVERHGPDGWVGRVRVGGDGTVLLRFAAVGREAPWSLAIEDILMRINRIISAGRGLLADLGAHGELLVGILIQHEPGDRVVWNTSGGSGSTALLVRLDRQTRFGADPVADRALIESIHLELARSVGIGPPSG